MFSLVLLLFGPPCLVPVESTADGIIRFSVSLAPGIYRITALLDASGCDWERFYLPMEKFGNLGQRSGPWDFDFDGAKPLLPAWWFSLNGERLGIVMAQRPSISESHNKRLSMQFNFEVAGEGEAHIELEPYNTFEVTALHFRLEPEFDDRPVQLSFNKPLHEVNWAAAQIAGGELRQWREKLDTTHTHYRPLMEKAIVWAKGSLSAEALPLLAFAQRAYTDKEAGALLQGGVLSLIGKEHWGNPHPDGYGHDADMGAAAILEPLSFVLHWADLDEALREELKAKLQLQMERFYTQLLLWNGFWGGSILQDHGHRSVSRFGVAAINLLGVLPDAEKWLAFAAQRMDRVLEALSPDGAVPFTSYHKVHLYMDAMTVWRDALLDTTGRDIFDLPLFQKIVSFVTNRLFERTCEVLCASPRGDRKDFYSGWGFFNAIAAKYSDPGAARLSEILRELYAVRPMALSPATTLLTALRHDAGLKSQPLRPAIFDCRFESGLVSYRPGADVQVSMRCAVPAGLHSYYRVKSPTDRIKDAPLEGHFTVSVGEHTLLLTAEGGYRMKSSLGCALIIDGKGAYGDDDYAMGIPGVSYRGEQIETAWHDEQKQEAYVRINLWPAYPREAALLSYYREFLLKPDGLVCRDIVVSAAPHEYSWNFQTYARRQIEQLDKTTFRISDGDASLTLNGQCLENDLVASTGNTEVVWAYHNENHDEPFRHIRFATALKQASVTAEFLVQW